MQNARKLSALALWLLVAGSAVAQSLVIENGTVHPVTAEPFVGRVVIEDGRIVAAAADAAVPTGARRIDAAGLHVWPGLLDAMTTIGLLEVGSVPATDDQAEMGGYNPHLRAVTAVHPASEIIPVTRANGITHALVTPRTDNDGVIAGQAALVHLAGWTVEEMTIEPSVAMVISWPRIRTRRFDFSTFSIEETPYSEAEEKAREAQNELRDWIDAARHYRQAAESASERLEVDAKLAALSECLERRKPVIVLADEKRDIEDAIALTEQAGLKMILAGARDAWKVKERLAEARIPVILGLTLSLPDEEDLPYDRPFRNAGELVEAGVLVAFATGAGGGFGPSGPHGSRTLPYEAAAAVAYGLSEEDALRAVTINAARIFGIDDRLGSIEPGKVANLIVTDGHPLEIRSEVRHLVIAGREVSTDNRHEVLYRHYRSRPREE
jgi:imidazolonepropionase-like amidohydrolase